MNGRPWDEIAWLKSLLGIDAFHTPCLCGGLRVPEFRDAKISRYDHGETKHESP